METTIWGLDFRIYILGLGVRCGVLSGRHLNPGLTKGFGLLRSLGF